ncbi:MAG: 2-amino-4-hydroxy-6-hydroxymethyldihydropteridine pyrophosphokinae [Symbiobacteriaceae bacterium]|jgi:2-amino-4-hydroxy-6-hydroxymethyldihydropteridine diphosphokinase|nr:2-amino-4-hydroxy-6-hydroxymethyldihydropteridine pyrophosphokinae [Symbiobacteriaceae bacterium]
MATAYLSLGSNLGDRLGYLAEAIRRLGAPHTRVTQVSSIYETAPWGKTDQPSFLNMAAAVETDLTPDELLRHILSVEQVLGRVRTVRWGPRTVDIDMLLYGDERRATPDLQLPHPRMANRAFVLVPLLEIAPHLPYREALDALDPAGIDLFMGAEVFQNRTNGVQ